MVIIALRILFACTLIAAVGALFIFFGAHRNSMAELNLAERQYAAATAYLAQYDANRLEFDALQAARERDSRALLADIAHYAAELSSAEPVPVLDGAVRLYEQQVRFVGDAEKSEILCEVESLGGRVRSFSLDFETSRFEVNFSLFEAR